MTESTNVNITSNELPELVIGESITIFSVPFARGGKIPFGGRSTAIKLQNSSVWLVASHPLTPLTLSTLNSLGPVTHIVTPDKEHDMYLSQYAKAFPQAKLYVPTSVSKSWEMSEEGKKKGEGLKERVGAVFGENKECPFETETKGEILSADFGKGFVNEDVAFLHVPTKTLIQADLLFNLPPTEQYSKTNQKATFPFFTSAMKPGSFTQKMFIYYLLGKDKVDMTKNAKIVSAWDFDRIIPCHGDVIETGGKKAWDSTYAWYLKK